MENMARILIFAGIVLLLAGLIFLGISKLGIAGFKLPGDLYIKKGNTSIYFPVVSCILISLILTLIFNLISRR
ncbi:MAG: DUF2905 domain-containing protein [Syntrophomonadaceae bacterium]|nr:DUF2905 domain-containing protein [Syntrophomonadaceae bacterium]